MNFAKMRSLIVLALAAGLCVAAPVTLFSGSYHAGSNNVCSDCHSMHYYEQGITPPPGADAGGPFDKLLKKTSTNSLCLSCHDGDTGANCAPDVVTTAGADHAMYRAAGAFRAAVGVSSAQAHDLGIPGQTAPGGTWSTPAGTGMTCASCHDVHGNSNYRNLTSSPGGVAGLNVSDVSETVLTPTATQYSVPNIKYTGDTYSRWCRGCHLNFHLNPYAATFTNDANLGGSDAGDTSAGTTDQWDRHPASHVTMGEGNTNKHVDSAAWIAAASRTPVIDLGAAGASVEDMVFCGSCHKGHGSDRDRTQATAFEKNLIYDDSSTATIQDGTALYQLCQGCHNE